MTFDNLVLHCPNPCCAKEMKLLMQELDSRLASFQCKSKYCKIDVVSVQFSLLDKFVRKRN